MDYRGTSQKELKMDYVYEVRGDNGFNFSNNFSASINPPSGPRDKYFMDFQLFQIREIRRCICDFLQKLRSSQIKKKKMLSKLMAQGETNLGIKGSAKQ